MSSISPRSFKTKSFILKITQNATYKFLELKIIATAISDWSVRVSKQSRFRFLTNRKWYRSMLFKNFELEKLSYIEETDDFLAIVIY